MGCEYMANRFWIGGSGNWDASTTTHWSSTTGGAGGASVPTSADNVFVDANSGTSPTITVTATASCLDLDFTGAITPTFAVNSTLIIYGFLKFISSMSLTQSGIIAFESSSSGKTVTTAGIAFHASLSFEGAGGWILQDDILSTSTIAHSNGSLDTNNKNITCTTFNITGTNVRTLTLGSSILNLAASWTATLTTNLTFNVGTSTITMNSGVANFTGGGLAYNNVNIINTAITTITDANTFNTISIDTNSTLKIKSGTTQTITNLVSNGTGSGRATLKSSIGASSATISTASTINQSFLIVQDITKAGAGSITFNLSQDVSGNTGITFNNILYWIGGTGNTNDTAHWSLTSGGTTASCLTSSYISARFDSSSFSGAGQVVTVNATINCLDMDWTGATNSPTLAGSSTLNVYGSYKNISSMIINLTGQLMNLATSTGKTFTSAGITFLGNVYFNGAGGGWTLQDDLNLGTSQLALLLGTLTTNDKTLIFGNFNSNASGVRTMNLGASVINCSGAWTCTNSANFTLNAGTSTLNMTGNTKIFDGGGLTYNNVILSGTPTTVANSNTFNTLTLTAGKTVKFTIGTTQTITNLIANGTIGNVITIQSTTSGTAFTISIASGTETLDYCSIKDCTATGGATFYATNSTNVSGNTGIAFVTLLTAALSGIGSMSSLASLTFNLLCSISGTGTMSSNANMIMNFLTTLSGTGGINANFMMIFNMIFGASGIGSLQANLNIGLRFASHMSGMGTISANYSRYHLNLITFTGNIAPGDKIVIDAKKMTITKNGVNAFNLMTGDFFNIEPGENDIIYSDTESSRTILMRVTNRDKYLY